MLERILILQALCGAVDLSPDPVTEGLFTTAPDELLKETQLQVNGTVPTWLCGDYLKQSASQFEAGKRSLTHAFDGYGKLLRWRFRSGGVSLQARFLQSNFFNQSTRHADICPCRLLGSTSPKESEAKALTNNCTDNFNVNVDDISGQVLALSDYEGAMEVNMADLTAKRWHWNDTWSEKTFDQIAPAHPSKTLDGDFVSFVMRVNPATVSTGVGDHSIIVYRVKKDSNKREIIQTIKVKRLPYIHSFTVTENYVVLTAAPLVWKLREVMAAEPVLDALEWSPQEDTVIYAIPLSNDKEGSDDGMRSPHRPSASASPLVFKAGAFFTFHHVNGYETTAADGSPLLILDILAANMTSGQVLCMASATDSKFRTIDCGYSSLVASLLTVH
jgi:carotenoid cleavage dioxygenase-like enzyme